MKTPHKHAELIKAWADGYEIQYQTDGSGWFDIEDPSWHEDTEYRIKPEPKPNVIYYGAFGSVGDSYFQGTFTKVHTKSIDRIKLTFDGETGALKAAEVLK